MHRWKKMSFDAGGGVVCVCVCIMSQLMFYDWKTLFLYQVAFLRFYNYEWANFLINQSSCFQINDTKLFLIPKIRVFN